MKSFYTTGRLNIRTKNYFMTYHSEDGLSYSAHLATLVTGHKALFIHYKDGFTCDRIKITKLLENLLETRTNFILVITHKRY